MLAYDYRGMGGSKPAMLKGFVAAMHDWGELDMTAAFEHIVQECSPDKLYAIGQSAGGQLFGLARNCERVDAMVTVAAQSGSLRHWPFRKWRKYSFALGVYFLIPLLANLLGYFPSSRVGLGEDLPKGVALEWARWCRSPHYLFSYPRQFDLSRYAMLHLPILAYSFEDDDFAPEPAVDALFTHYPNASVTRKHVRPSDIEAEKIGHFGFFRREFRDTLWREVCEWLKQH